jgi:hypothetical protein
MVKYTGTVRFGRGNGGWFTGMGVIFISVITRPFGSRRTVPLGRWSSRFGIAGVEITVSDVVGEGMVVVPCGSSRVIQIT